MKRIVSVSLGSSKRDHSTTVTLLGEQFDVRRVGVDGDIDKALIKLRELDGHVDAIGLGGIDIYLYSGNKRFIIREAFKLMSAVKKTPVVDGSGLKNTLEKEVIKNLATDRLIKPNAKVLMVSAVDRFGMAQAFCEAGCDVVFADLIFCLGIPYPVKTLHKLSRLADVMLPVITKLPFKWLYPTGKKQDSSFFCKEEKYTRFYREAEIIAGDYHLIRKYLPEKLNGQIIITNTITAKDIEVLSKCKANMVITTTPKFEGRSFGTNVIEAMFVSMLNKPWDSIMDREYIDLLKKIHFKPRIIKLKGK